MEDVVLADEVAYYTRTAQYRYEISRLMSNHLLIDEIDTADGKLNTCYGRTSKNFKAGIAVEFLNDVIPYCLHTPLGAVEINPHESKQTLELTYEFLTDQQKINFIRDFKCQFGAVVLQTYHATSKGNASQPLIYQLTKLPSEITAQQEQCPVLLSPKILPPQQIADEQKHWEQIRKQVDDLLRAKGQQAMTFTDAKIAKRKSMVTEIRPKLPDYLENKIQDRMR